MQFIIEDQALSHVETIFRNVAQEFRKSIEDSFFFDAKLNILVVEIKKQAGCIESCFLTDYSRNACSIRIVLYVHADDAPDEIAWVCAHELAHCFMCNMRLGAFITHPDKSNLFSSSVIRCDEEGVEFGRGIEEGLAELLSAYIISRIPEYAKGRSMNKFLSAIKNNDYVKAVYALANCFGSRLEQMDTLDHVVPEGIMIRWNPPVNLPTVSPVYSNIQNPFWLMLANQSFPEVSAIYDEVMGSGAYRTLCENIEQLYAMLQRRKSAEEMLLQALLGQTHKENLLKDIKAELRRFRALHKNERFAPHKTVAAESLREAIRQLRSCCTAMKIRMPESAVSEALPLIKDLQSSLNLRRPFMSIRAALAKAEALYALPLGDDEPARAAIHDVREILHCARQVVDTYTKPE